MQKLRVGVLMGGRSIEREVSLNSGRTICDHLDTAHYIIVPIFQQLSGALFILPERFLHRGKTADFEHRLAREAQSIGWDELANYIDFAYIAMHGRYAEDGSMQGFLEVLKIPYFGSKVFASALGMNKIMQKDFLRMAGIAVPQGIAVSRHEVALLMQQNSNALLTAQLAALTYPVIVKPCQEGSSLGVRIVTEKSALVDAIIHAATITPDRLQAVIVEEKIEGMEFSCTVITDYTTGALFPLSPTEIVPESAVFEYDQKYMPGRAHKYTPARCTPEQLASIQSTCVATVKALGITNLGRIDGFLTKDNRVVIIDPNTFSGMAPSSYAFTQAAQHNIGHTELINHLIATEIHQSGLFEAAVAQQSKKTSMDTKKIRIAVLFGGASAEREISLESGRNIIYKLSPQLYEAVPVFMSADFKPYIIDQKLLVRNATHEIEAGLESAQKILWTDLKQKADFVFIALHGGLGENGSVQGMLEMLDMPYNGSSVLASALCMDKFKTAQFLAARGFDVPQGALVAAEQGLVTCEQLFGDRVKFPLIIKPHDDGCSVLVQKAANQQEFADALQAIFSAGRTHALVEECVGGTELTIGVLGNDTAMALPPSQAIARGGILSIEEKFLPGAGENQTPALLPASVLRLAQKTIEDAYVALQCKGYARIDCFYQTADESPTGHERIVVLEVNTLPGMTPATCIFHQAAELGIKPMDFIDRIIKLGLEEHAKRNVAQQDAIPVPASAEIEVR